MPTNENLANLYDEMNRFDAFRRKHYANIFDVLFKDVDYDFKDEELLKIVSDVAFFFNLEIPIVNAHCDSMAKMLIEPNGQQKSELFYNLQLMRKEGINNKEAFTLCIVHELAHLYFKGKRFFLCKNERWCHELAADYIVGIYSTLNGIGSGKYKFVVSRLESTLTHPKGTHRADIVEYARMSAFKLPGQDIESLLLAFPAFMYKKSKILNQELLQCFADKNKVKVESVSNKPINIEALPDSNLIKQYIMNHRNNNNK